MSPPGIKVTPVDGTRRREHITPVLRQLHWLPVRLYWIQTGSFDVQSAEWHSAQWMAWLHNIWWMTVSLPLLPADDDYDRPTSPRVRVRFQELAQVWAITHSLLLDRGCGQPTSPSTWFWIYFPGVLPVTEDALVLLSTAAPSDCLLLCAL